MFIIMLLLLATSSRPHIILGIRHGNMRFLLNKENYSLYNHSQVVFDVRVTVHCDNSYNKTN